MSSELLRGVFDNNVLVSAALLAGVPRQAIDKLLDNGTVLVSVPVLLELAEVLNREKFDKYVTHYERMRFMVSFLKVAEMVEISETITVCRDPKDDKLLELAVDGNADFLVTGDKDLLVLNPFRGVEIITPREFLDKTL
ncbi:MAG: putative toxin-antitoxin system toxin component, PIN family [Acidobacteria bacterium]|nr:putative toxin-antitoxin system toxin component, PIN family [Acidobacteriota bacterium]MCA1637972.1 putative toxin-antitoxin system toxin component, PIN family [Acidobacteriota bacterium]